MEGKLEAYPTRPASWKLTPRGVCFQLAIPASTLIYASPTLRRVLTIAKTSELRPNLKVPIP